MAEHAHDLPLSPDEGENRLRALRAIGAAQSEPLRLQHAEQLAQRARIAAGALRDALLARRDAALADLEERMVRLQQAARDAVAQAAVRSPAQARALRRLFAAQDYRGVRREAARPLPDTAAAPLAQLNQALRARGRGAPAASAASAASAAALAPAEMASVRRFRESWLRQAAQEQVAQAALRQPPQAGPLNSQMLALRSLALMGELSPDYLWRFLAQADTWDWLEQAGLRLAAGQGAARRGGRARKK